MDRHYFVYKHSDIDRTHFHIVSTRIDCETGKKFKDNYEKEKTQRFIKSLEQKYDLTKEQNQVQANLKFSAGSRNLKQNLESLFYQLNRIESISTKQLYDKSLELFNVEVRRSGRGHIVVFLGDDGKPARYPIRLSKFKNKPKFYSKENRLVEQELVEKQQSQQQKKPDISEVDLRSVGVVVRDLNRLMERSKWQKDNPKTKYKTRKKKRGKRF